ncbi:Sporulation and spore germination [Caloramator fervidus]|uniref:Sporulation and spore germination n=1 Tax=Caloramator fervidus TaxID=29344 RepID=A0A1H5TDU0_9CLOT|nr:GerMN domain-containing protein [Caloramator fervidus]SEF60924.1 Sporulation and spore germination [Caloramator fervidus]
MKKIISLIILTLMFISCSKTPNSNQFPEPKKYTVKDYFPFIADRRMKYQGLGNEYAEMDVYVDFIKNNRIQLRILNPGTVLAQVYEIKDGELRLIKSQEEFYYRDNIIDSKSENPDILLKEPIKVGTEWTTKEGYKRYISNLEKEIETPYGKFKALEVTTEGKDYKTYDYYVLNIGLVKKIFETNNNKIETNLEKIENNASLIQNIAFYYPDFLKEKIAFKEETIKFKTNESTIEKFESLLKNPPREGLTRVLSPNTKINNMYFNPQENKIYIDLSKEFITEMNAGSSLEAMIIQSLVNTLCRYYNTDKVYISLDGNPYESGHIAINKDEFFKPDYKNTIEVK